MDKYNSKLIVTLVAKDHLAEKAWKENKDYYVSLYDFNNGGADLSSRETTPAYQILELKLEITFGYSPKVPQRGFMFESILRAYDVLLEIKRNGFSDQYFSITFDKKGRLVLKDTSTYGTRISYSG